jgi:hypothetical protein
MGVPVSLIRVLRNRVADPTRCTVLGAGALPVQALH